jgi:hypothetical protein
MTSAISGHVCRFRSVVLVVCFWHTRLLARMPQHLPRIRYMLGELVGRVTSVANNKTVRQQTQHCIA